MNGAPKVRAVWSGLAIGVLSLTVGYFGIEGLVTGRARVLSTYARYAAITGDKAIAAAIAYSVFAVSLALFALMCFSAEPTRQDHLFKWGMRVMVISGVILFSGLLLK